MRTPSDDARLPLRNVAFLTACSLLQMVLQFLLLTLVARWFGTSIDVDAFNAAFAVPLAVSTVLAAPLPLVLVPEMVRLSRSEGDTAQAYRLAASVLGLFAAVGILLAVAIWWWAAGVSSVLFSGFESRELELVIAYLRRLCWLIPLNGAITLLQAVYHASERFRLAAVSNVLGVTMPLLWVAPLADPRLMDIATGTVVGGVVAVAILLLPLARSLAAGWVGAGPYRCGLWRFGVLVTPLVVAGVYSRIDPLVDRMIASHLDPGSIAELGYAQRLVMAMAVLVSSGLSIAIFPQLADEGDGSPGQRHGGLLALAWRFLIFLLVPCVVAVVVFGRPIVADLFQGGEFGPRATANVAFLLSLLMGVLVAGSVGEIAAKSLYSRGRTKGPALVAVTGFTVGVILKIVLAEPFGIAGVAAATSIYYLMNVTALLWLVYRAVGREAFVGVRLALIKAVVASTAAVALGALPVLLLDRGGAAVGGCVGLVAYALAQWALGNEFAPSPAGMSFRRSGNQR